MDNQKDHSGIDVLTDEVVKYDPVPAPVTNREPAPVVTYNLAEVAIKWGCTRDRVQKEISRGMPMVKKPNGRWEIREADLILWEERMTREEAEAAARKRRSTIVSLLVGVIAVVAAAVVVWNVLN